METERNEQNAVNERLNAEIIRLRNAVEVYEDEQKEDKMKIAALQEKVKELELKTLDSTKFTEWNWEQIVFWIMSLENGRFKGYEEVLKAALSAAEMEGEDLLSVNPFMLKVWGMKDGKDREALNQYIQRLVQQHGPHDVAVVDVAAAAAPKENEGAPTAFVG